MNKLIFAGLNRLWKDKAFWVCFLVMFALGVYLPAGTYADSMRFNFVFSPDSLFLQYTPFVCLTAPIFVSLYLGVDYSDGAIRNKMMVGRTRTEIYMANWTVCVIGSLLLCLASAVPSTILGLLLPGTVITPPMAILSTAALSIFVVVGITSVYVMVSMLCQNKAVSAVGCLVVVILLFFAAMTVTSALSAPPTFENMVSFVDGKMVTESDVPNPAYLTGTKRAVYEFLDDFLPVDQALQCANIEIENPLRLALCGVGITLASILAGLGLFGRKDLK